MAVMTLFSCKNKAKAYIKMLFPFSKTEASLTNQPVWNNFPEGVE